MNGTTAVMPCQGGKTLRRGVVVSNVLLAVHTGTLRQNSGYSNLKLLLMMRLAFTQTRDLDEQPAKPV